MMNRSRRRRPYMGVAVFTLAAAGIMSFMKSAKDFMVDKARCVSDFLKKDVAGD